MGRPEEASSEVLTALLHGSHLAVPDDIPVLVAEHARAIGATDAIIYLVDHDQRILAPVPHPDRPARDSLPIEGTVAGRCYTSLDLHQSTGPDGTKRLWVPLLDGTERLGVLELDFEPGAGEGPDADVRALARLIAELVVTKGAYGDLFHFVRRRQPMSPAAELAWQLLPPLTFGNDQVVISAVLVPPYDLGGDTFDYAVDRRMARVAIFDAMGHGLESGLLASVALAVHRNSRRRSLGLVETAVAIDEAIGSQFGPERFVTAVLAELDMDSGRFRWSISGHPPPLLLRGGKIVKVLQGNVGAPLGLGLHAPVAEDVLEPGDQVILYTDGVVEARSAAGDFFGVRRLSDLVSRASAAGNPPPETMRRLIHAILDHQAGDLQDDATIVLVEWRGEGIPRLEM